MRSERKKLMEDPGVCFPPCNEPTKEALRKADLE